MCLSGKVDKHRCGCCNQNGKKLCIKIVCVVSHQWSVNNLNKSKSNLLHTKVFKNVYYTDVTTILLFYVALSQQYSITLWFSYSALGLGVTLDSP